MSLIVYKASAGSGKTFTLTAQYVALLLESERGGHREILAVTFTNKATAEMKERILQALWEMSVALQCRPDDETLSDLERAVMEQLRDKVSAKTLRQRAARALHVIVHDYDFFAVSTIDAFFQSLLASLAHDLGLSAGFRVEIGDGEVEDEAVDHLMKLLGQPGGNEVTAWALDYIRERIAADKSWNISGELKQYARMLNRESFMLSEDVLMPVITDEKALGKMRDALWKSKEQHLRRLHDEAEALLEVLGGEAGCLEMSRGKDLYGRLVKMIGGDFSEPSVTFVGKWAGDDDLALLKNADQNKPEKLQLAETTRMGIKQLLRTRETVHRTVYTCELLQKVINPLRMLGAIGGVMKALNEENNRFMLARTPLLFKQLVTSAAASFVFERVGTRFRHIMIDEFQDTSPLQWANFQQLLLEETSQGDTCLLVGDVKQGIYRFRGGDWKILQNIEQEFRTQNVGVKSLSVNYRSRVGIVSFNNALFPRLALRLDNFEREAQLKSELNKKKSKAADAIFPTLDDDFLQEGNISAIYADVEETANKQSGGHVELRYVYPEPKAEEEGSVGLTTEDVPAELARVIRSLQAKAPAESIAILVRYNKDVRQLVDIFSAPEFAGINLISDEAFLLSSSHGVVALVGALTYIESRHQRLISHAEKRVVEDRVALTYVARVYQEEVLLSDTDVCLIALQPENYLPEALTADTEALWHMPLYELCMHLLDLLDFKLVSAWTPYLYAFLDLVLDFLEKDGTCLADFLRRWEEKYYKTAIPANAVDGVRIITIHKSKGLAFDNVLMPYCNWVIAKDRSDSFIWCKTPVGAPFNTLPVAPINVTKKMKESLFSEIYEREHAEMRAENLNLLYVAFTRPKNNLYIWAHTSGDSLLGGSATIGDLLYACLDGQEIVHDGPAASSPGRLNENTIEAVEASLIQRLEAKGEIWTPKFVLNKPRVEYRQSNSAAQFVSEANAEALGTPVPEDEKRGQSYIDQGKLLHYALSLMKTAEDLPQALLRIREEGLETDAGELQKMEKRIRSILQMTEVNGWFAEGWTVLNECSILFRDRESGRVLTVRPDRVVTSANETIVIDFKFARPADSHRTQVRKYMMRLLDMGYSNVKGYLLYGYLMRTEEVVISNSKN